MINGIEYSWISLLPPLVALVLSFATRQVLLSLFAGICTGGFVLFLQTAHLFDSNAAGFFERAMHSSIIEQFFIPSLGSRTFAIILLVYLWSLGGIIGMWEKTGGAHYFASKLGGKLAKGPRASLLFTWIIGMIFHQGGTVSTVLAGTTAKPITDQHRVSHEELAYMVDSTASPIATIIPLNAWPIYVGGLIVGSVPFLPDTASAYAFYISSIPYNFYALITVIFTFLFAINWLPCIGKRMRQAQIRARETGELDAPNAKPLISHSKNNSNISPNYQTSMIDFLVPIGLLLSMTIIPFVLWKQGYITQEHSDWIKAAFLTASISSMLLAYFRGMPLSEIIDGFSRGCKSMTLGAVIIGLAITLGVVTQKVGTAQYLIMLTQDLISPYALPAILTLLCMVVAFATGTSLGTYAVVYPVAMPLAYSICPEGFNTIFYMKVCFSAVLGGTVFGDQCSPISDTTILSSMFTGCDLMDHVRTQIPLALASAGLAVILSTAALLFA